MTFDAMVLAGGTARRLGGADKVAVEVGGRRLLDRALDACSEAHRVVVVGPQRDVGTPVEWAREEPPGAGPVAALDAGLARVTRPIVVVLAADLPFVDEALVARLAGSLAGVDGAVVVDAEGREQPLAAAYRVVALRARLRCLPATAGASMRAVVGGMVLRRIESQSGARDCDTWEEVAAARRELGR